MSATALSVVLLATLGVVHGLAPSGLECGEGLLDIGLDDLVERLIPCALGPVPNCCNEINPIFKLARGAIAPGCLCNNLLLDEVIGFVEANELAMLAGFGRQQILDVFQGCGTNFFGGTGDAACPNVEPVGIRVKRPRPRDFGTSRDKHQSSGGLFGTYLKPLFQKNLFLLGRRRL